MGTQGLGESTLYPKNLHQRVCCALHLGPLMDPTTKHPPPLFPGRSTRKSYPSTQLLMQVRGLQAGQPGELGAAGLHVAHDLRPGLLCCGNDARGGRQVRRGVLFRSPLK